MVQVDGDPEQDMTLHINGNGKQQPTGHSSGREGQAAYGVCTNTSKHTSAC